MCEVDVRRASSIKRSHEMLENSGTQEYDAPGLKSSLRPSSGMYNKLSSTEMTKRDYRNIPIFDIRDIIVRLNMEVPKKGEARKQTRCAV
jgi:hypothetical protein